MKSKEEIKAHKRNYYDENIDSIRAIKSAWYYKHRKKIIARNNQYRLDNIEKYREYTRNWQKKNPGAKLKVKAYRRAKEKNATPLWKNDFFIEEIYDLAVKRTKITGLKWHVDHIIPLQHKLVCGLHCEYNLQVIPAHENLKKSNKFEIT